LKLLLSYLSPQSCNLIYSFGLAFEGKNVFITGVAGTGKSLVTQKIVNDSKNLRKQVAVAAPTGVAAVNLGPDLAAQTIHSLAGCGVPQSARDFEKIMSRWNASKWRNIEVLVFDEVGMLKADYLGTLCGVANMPSKSGVLPPPM
jgi:ATP-dependent DNA helicase PIF1